jgi:tetratricopeptide (TPR) repeat protein
MKGYSLVLFVTFLTACGAAAPAEPAQSGTNAGRGEVEVPRTVVTPHDARTIPELLRDAAALAETKRYQEAAAAYDRVYQLEPEGAPGDDAIWGAAEAYDQLGHHEAALSRFELFATRQPDSPKGAAALVRAARLLVFLGRFQPAGLHADRLLKKLDLLGDLARVSVYSAKALSVLERGDERQASYFIEKAREIVDSKRLDSATVIHRDLAPLYFALGESRRIQAERIRFEPLPPNFAAVLEARCQLLLDAQSAYADAMRANDAHWSAIAGYRVAELYQKLHQELLAIRIPPSASTEREKQLYEGAVRTRYAILLKKAKAMAEHTLTMATRTGESSAWVERTRQALRTIDQAISAEEAALAKLPYTRQDFEAYFAQMEAAGAKPSKPSPAGPSAPKPSP